MSLAVEPRKNYQIVFTLRMMHILYSVDFSALLLVGSGHSQGDAAYCSDCE